MAAPKLELRQSQSLVMTQQLQQSIKLLQFSAIELREFIHEELEKNPLLQEDGQGGEQSSAEVDDRIAGGDGSESSSQNEEGGNSEHDRDDDDASFERDSFDLGERQDDRQEDMLDKPTEENWESSEWQEQQFASGKSSGNAYDDDLNLLEHTASERISLKDHLLEHLLLSTQDIAQRLIGRHLIDLVNEAGYLAGEYTNLTETLQCSRDELDAVVELLQRCEPAGICARNLAECLSLQLAERNRLDPAMQALLKHLDLLSQAAYDKLERICGVDREDLRDMVAEIKALNPKPGLQFDIEISQPIEPDVLIGRKQNRWQIELNPQALPRVLVNQPYFIELSTRSNAKDDKKYLNEQLAHANWLVRALDQRAKTILKVSREIVKRQENFFKYGIRYLVPLTLREVADAIEMHESTVSRVTNNKYMATPSGLYELKYFFTSSVASARGSSDVSSKTVQHLIKQLTDEEEGENILSDDALVVELKQQGIDIARRTVAKYRELMNIPSSTQRRKMKNNCL